MNLYFNIDYQTVFGEELVLNIVTNNGKGECQTIRSTDCAGVVV